MKLAVIGDTLHHLDRQGRLCTLEPVAAQLDQWAALFDEVVLCAVLADGPPPAGFAPYRATNVRIEPIRAGGGATWRAKAGLVPLALHWWRRIRSAATAADALHFRAPCNVALVGLVATARVRRKHYAHYAGAWTGYAGEPLSYWLQRWILTHWFRGPVTVYAEDPGRPHLIPFFSPSLSLDEHRQLSGATRSPESEVGAPPDSLRLITVGRLTRNKNQAAAVEAAALLVAGGLDVSLDIVGDGPERDRLETLVGRLGMTERVTFYGAVSHGRVLQLLASGDFNVLATRQEGYGKVVLEGMSAGCVPIVGRSPMAAALTGEGVRGRVVERVTPAEIAGAVLAVRSDPQRWAAMIDAGRAYAGEHTLEAFRARVRAMLEEHWGVRL